MPACLLELGRLRSSSSNSRRSRSRAPTGWRGLQQRDDLVGEGAGGYGSARVRRRGSPRAGAGPQAPRDSRPFERVGERVVGPLIDVRDLNRGAAQRQRPSQVFADPHGPVCHHRDDLVVLRVGRPEEEHLATLDIGADHAGVRPGQLYGMDGDGLQDRPSSKVELTAWLTSPRALHFLDRTRSPRCGPAPRRTGGRSRSRSRPGRRTAPAAPPGPSVRVHPRPSRRR